jgi:hypothetical protein
MERVGEVQFVQATSLYTSKELKAHHSEPSESSSNTINHDDKGT